MIGGARDKMLVRMPRSGHRTLLTLRVRLVLELHLTRFKP